jgi:hypothetical protein
MQAISQLQHYASDHTATAIGSINITPDATLDTTVKTNLIPEHPTGRENFSQV